MENEYEDLYIHPTQDEKTLAMLSHVLGTFSLVVSIVAAIKALDGKLYRYPLCIRFIS